MRDSVCRGRAVVSLWLAAAPARRRSPAKRLSSPGLPAESTPEDYEKWRRDSMNNASKPAAVKYLVPRAYGDSKTSGLKATVKKGRNSGTDFQIDLTSDFKGTGL